MHSTELTAALAEIDAAFNGEASPAESGCARYCCTAEDAAYLRNPHSRVPADLLNRFLHKGAHHFTDHEAAACVEQWLDDLMLDRRPGFPWEPSAATLTELQTWLGAHAPARLRALGLPGLADRTALLALPYATCWNDPYWSR